MAKTEEYIDRVIDFVRDDNIDCCYLCPCGQNEESITGLPDGQCARANDTKILDWCDKNKSQLYFILKNWLDDYSQSFNENFREMIGKAMEESK